jgi:hypothetical protein
MQDAFNRLKDLLKDVTAGAKRQIESPQPDMTSFDKLLQDFKV